MRRSERYGDEVYRILADLVYKKINDPRISGIASLTGVEMSGDLSIAKVFYSVYGTDENRAGAKEAFQKASGFLRKELASRLRSKKVPSLIFIEDMSLRYGESIDKLLKSINPSEADDS
ncbi:MAG TPA: 30S ribosome-binding factor RbfA, partial [Bacillota bacterium]|nr:30S ribosome-binding factor RbfA [Bacillota bacterium]